MAKNESIRSVAHGLHPLTEGLSPAAVSGEILKRISLPMLILCLCLTVSAPARAQSYYFVDCSGTIPNDYSTIGSALAVAGPGSYVLITGTCNENVNITNAWNLNVGAFYGSTATINGNVSVTASNSVFLYGLNVTNPSGDAFDISGSHNVTLWTCTANGNHGGGLSANHLSYVIVEGPGSFDDNGAAGMGVSENSVLDVLTWSGPVDISGNHGPGVTAGDGAMFQTLGNTTITNNINVAVGGPRPNGFGIQALSASKIQVANCAGTTQISGNESGGIDVRENSQLSIWNCGTIGENVVRNNGPVGLNVGLGSEVALYDNVVISGHTGPGVELSSNSSLCMYGPNVISQNGNAGDPRSAGVVADGDSEVFLRGGTISANVGPGVLALVNSSLDSVGATFSGNTGGIAKCDSSAYMVSDLLPAGSNPPAGILCRTPHNLGNQHMAAILPHVPDMTGEKKKAGQYQAMASPKK